MNPSEYDILKNAGIPAIVAVILVVLFLKSFKWYAESRDRERQTMMTERDMERRQFMMEHADDRDRFLDALSSMSEGVVALVGLAVFMAQKCQQSTGPYEKVTPQQVVDMGQETLQAAHVVTREVHKNCGRS